MVNEQAPSVCIHACVHACVCECLWFSIFDYCTIG